LLIGQVVEFDSAFVAAFGFEVFFHELLNFRVFEGWIQRLKRAIFEDGKVVFSSVQEAVERNLGVPE
jgi:hypothetical protein